MTGRIDGAREFVIRAKIRVLELLLDRTRNSFLEFRESSSGERRHSQLLGEQRESSGRSLRRHLPLNCSVVGADRETDRRTDVAELLRDRELVLPRGAFVEHRARQSGECDVVVGAAIVAGGQDADHRNDVLRARVQDDHVDAVDVLRTASLDGHPGMPANARRAGRARSVQEELASVVQVVVRGIVCIRWLAGHGAAAAGAVTR